MAYKILIEDKVDFEWLKWLMGKSYAKIQNDPTALSEIASHVINITQALEKATVVKEDDDSSKKKVVGKKTKKTTSKESATYKYNYCKAHPLYPAKRAPRKDCDGCWTAYKKLNPNNYPVARRNFERKYMNNNG